MKGTVLEERVENIIRSLGYNVSRNKRLKGRSGLYHRPDLTFEVNGKQFIVECKTRFTRERIMSVYGKATDLDVSHVFLVGYDFPEIEVYKKRFDLSLLVIDENKTSERKLEEKIKNVVNQIISEDKESHKSPLKFTREINSYYFFSKNPLELESISIPIPKGALSTYVVSEGLIRIDFYGSHLRVSRYIRKIMKTESLTPIMPKIAMIKPFFQEIEKSYEAKLVRFGLAAPKAYMVVNARFSKSPISLNTLEKFIADRKGDITSLRFRLFKNDYLYVDRTPSLHLKYRGKSLDAFSKIRKDFEQLSLGR